MSKRTIKSVVANQVYTDRDHPGIEAVVTTEGGDVARAMCTAGVSVGTHEIKFTYDGGKAWGGMGVLGAVKNVNEIIGPAIIGMDAADQLAVDSAILGIMPDAKIKLGGNATAAVSAAVLKAGAAALDIPLYRHIGGANAMNLPVPAVAGYQGHMRYGGGVTTPGTKPTVTFVCHGFSSFYEASMAGWEIQQKWFEFAEKHEFGNRSYADFFLVRAGLFKSDEELWSVMTDIIQNCGLEGRVGIQMDCASDTYYDPKTKTYRGLYDTKERTRDELLDYYQYMVKEYPFVILEDPFNENDYESHALLTQLTGIQIVGDDLFTTNKERVLQGSRQKAANTVLLKVNQIGTISEAFDMVQFAYKQGYGVMPCESRGEGVDIADYCVGINACAVREMAVGHVANRFLEIERELGDRARFLGTSGLKGEKFQNCK